MFGRSSGSDDSLLQAKDVGQSRIDTQAEWFRDIFDKAYSAVEWVYDVQKASRTTGTVQIRPFFRDQKLYGDMVSRVLR